MTRSISYITDPRIFWIVQAILIPIVIGSTWFASGSINRRQLVPELNLTPRTIRPKFDFPFVISDRQLNDVLYQLRPRFDVQPPKINFVDHALRLWGRSRPVDDCSLGGKQLLAILTDHPTFCKQYGESSTPLLSVSLHGIAVTTRETKTSVSHVDHLMGTLSEIGTPLNFQVQTPEIKGSVGDILKNAVKNFRLNQREYEWTVLALALYIKCGQSWFSCDNQEIDFDLIADRLMRQRQPQGVCYGQHRLYTLTMLLRVNQSLKSEDQTPIFSENKAVQVHEYLLHMSRQFYQSQSMEGYWDGNWYNADSPIPDPNTDEMSRRLLATGHALEWWAMSPRSLHPPRETLVRAAQWLTRVIIEMDEKTIEANYTFLTHAARSLVLWRGKFAEEVEVFPPKHDSILRTELDHSKKFDFANFDL